MQRPQFVRVAENPHSGNAAIAGGGGYGPYFGSIPDFGSPPHGVRFSDVHEGSPAAKAGFKAGDVLVEFDGKPIENLYDFTYALRQHKPGDKVKVKVLRDGAPVVSDVVLTNAIEVAVIRNPIAHNGTTRWIPNRSKTRRNIASGESTCCGMIPGELWKVETA